MFLTSFRGNYIVYLKKAYLNTTLSFLLFIQILNISKNQIEELPSEIGALQNLKYINVSSNRLHSLPRSLGNCRKIESLDIANNKNLTELPVTLGNLIYLVNLVADDTITYPPPAVFKGGTSAVLAFLRKGEFFYKKLFLSATNYFIFALLYFRIKK